MKPMVITIQMKPIVITTNEGYDYHIQSKEFLEILKRPFVSEFLENHAEFVLLSSGTENAV